MLIYQLFFDDEHSNFETEKLGVTMCLVKSGTDWKLFEEGLEQWRASKGIKAI